MQTPDGQWRVQIVDTGGTHWYRLSHAGNTVDWLTITDVEQLLAHAGIDIGQLQESQSVA